MGIFTGKPENEPLHSGEVFNLWAHLYAAKGYLVTLQIMINHTGDHDLKVFLEDLLENCYKQEEQQTEAILKQNGIRLPPAPPARPDVQVEDIPAGARFNDPEIALLVQRELMVGKILCSYVMGISIRSDIAEMFGEFHVQKTEYEGKLLKITKEKGWLVPPPINLK
ncbi:MULTISPECIES: DUF3231 family protein [unclassified Bacillus (in: firmicutes)]|uniref:DUF3231 family protein n=1 Tax=unclassified Bacillus (in: firmicutes) TaxID=185979 RepID=UPI001BE6C8EA|nr:MULTISPECIES: DUF3231 family protein [unclassified Bacillus (in: firmicutes)]MBT2637865.1 DUF3231 family protein [Bacillus sp. ISL-39]MBT2661037.1 DUF3231 family protein [Bacillus sp. ISL-45]